MKLEEAIQKVCEDNHINMYEDVDHFEFSPTMRVVMLDGWFTIKDLKLLIDIFALTEAE